MKWPSDPVTQWPRDPATQGGAPGGLLTGSPRARAFALAAALLTFFTINPAAAQGPVSITVLRPDGTATQGHLAGLSDGELRVFDNAGRFTTLARGKAALLSLNPGSDVESALVDTGLLHLTDGQRLAGVWDGAADHGEALRWLHPQLGAVVVPLDQVARWSSPGAIEHASAVRRAEPADDDVVQLTNGERLTGFLYLPDSADSPAEGAMDVLLLAPGHAPDAPGVPVPVAWVVAVTLANPPLPPPAARGASAASTRVTLHDGTRLRASALSLGTGAASFNAQVAGQPLQVAVPTAAVKRVVFTEHQRDVLDLTGFVARPQPPQPQDVALWGPGLVGASVTPTGYRLAAPAQLVVSLPPGAAVVVGRAVLDLAVDQPASRAAWAGCTLQINGTPRVDLLLDAEHREVPFRVMVPAGATEITFTLDPGPRGPVLDTVQIVDALVLTAEP